MWGTGIGRGAGPRGAAGGQCVRPRLLVLLPIVAVLLGSQCGGSTAQRMVSDDFNSCIVDPSHWTWVDPRGDSQATIADAGTANAALEIAVPAGADHNLWVANDAPQLLQPLDDIDFRLEARFESPVVERFQMQGLVVEQSPEHFVRLDTHYDGTQQRVFAATVQNGSTQIHLDEPIPQTAPLHLQLERQGDLWISRYSVDGGEEWVELEAFAHELVVDAAGVFAGNFGSGGDAPAHTARIDYVIADGRDPVHPDGAPVPGDVSLTLDVLGPGSASTSPPGTTFACGTTVELTAVPDLGNVLLAWSGAVTGRENPVSMALLEDTQVSVHFGSDLLPPEISDVQVTPGPEGALVRWSTNEPSTGRVHFGATTDYELGTVDSDTTLGTDHGVLLEPLDPDSTYHLRIEAEDEPGNPAQGDDVAFTTTPPNGNSASGLLSDDFNACVIDTNVWTLIDPLGDASFGVSGAGSGDAVLEIGVPPDVEHEPGTTNLAPRVVQPAADTDFEIEVRFASDVTELYQEQGIIVEGTGGEYLRFDFFSDGSQRFLFAAAYTPTSSTWFGTHAIPDGGDGLYMRIIRQGDAWDQLWSLDGRSWNAAAGFERLLEVTGAGIFAGNEGVSGAIPGHTAVVDWFSVTAAPAVPEDTGSLSEQAVLAVTTDGPGSVAVEPDQPSYACGESVSLTAQPELGYAFDGWEGDLGGTTNPASLVMTSDRSVTAHFIEDVEPPVISNLEILRTSNGAIVRWETNEPTTSRVRFGLDANLGMEVFDPTFTTDHAVVIDGLDPELDYYFEVEVEDGVGFLTASELVLGAAPEGPEITLFQGTEQRAGWSGIPQPMWNLLGNVFDEDGVESVTVSVNGGASKSLSIGPDSFRLDEPGDFNAEIPYSSLEEGLNEIEVRATDGLGNESLAIMTLDLTTEVQPPPDLVVDWGDAAQLQDVATAVDGDWRLEGGTVRAVEMGYDRLLAIGDLSWTDYEVRVDVTFHGIEEFFESPSNGPALGLIARWPGHTPDGFQPARQWWPLGAFVAQRWLLSSTGSISQSTRMWATVGDVLASTGEVTLEEDEDYRMRLQAQGLTGGGTLYRFKLWKATDTEPSTWTLEGIDSEEDTPSGSLALVAHHVDVSWQSVTVSPLP